MSTAVPESVTDCGLLGALSVMVMDALLCAGGTGAAGENVMLITQLADGATLVLQLSVLEKSALLAPLIVMPEMVSAMLPLFVRVTGCTALVPPTI